jgi:peptidoglycan/LPS O-acetylase OafA/YrhL
MASEEEYIIQKATMIEKAFAAGKAFAMDKASKLEWNPAWTESMSSISKRIPPTPAWVSNSPLRNLPLPNVGSLLSISGRRNSRPLRPTAYLDGLRGFAALLVYILHHQLWAHDSLHADRIFENAWGYNHQYYFVTLPFIRTIFSGGHLAVAVFFVISGYVLSAKPLALLRQGELVKLGDNLASAVFRRWLRLYMPIISTTFVYMTLNFLIRGLSARKTEARYFEEVYKWYAELRDFSFIFRMGGEPWFTYNFHVWTIPLELKGSLVIYASLMAFSRCTRTCRLWLNVGLIYYFLWIVDGWYCAAFVAGMMLCDFDQMAQHDELPSWIKALEPHKKTCAYTMLVVGLWLGGVPSNTSDMLQLRSSWGWYYLSFLKPDAVFQPKAFYLSFAGFFIVVAVSRIGWLKAFFELPFNQQLGRVSYAFYLLHGPILWTVADRIYAAVGWNRGAHAINVSGWTNLFPLPRFGPLGLELNFLLAHLIIFPITMWAAKIGTALFDEPSIHLPRWIYKYVTTEKQTPAKLETKDELPK